MSRDIADTANPREPSSLGFSHFLVALGQVNRRLSDELSLIGDDPDVVAGDVEAYSGASPGSTHAEMEHLVPEAEADLAGRVDLVVADAEVRVHPLHAGGGPFPGPVRATLVVVLDDAVHLALELGDRPAGSRLTRNPLSVWCHRSTLP